MITLTRHLGFLLVVSCTLASGCKGDNEGKISQHVGVPGTTTIQPLLLSDVNVFVEAAKTQRRTAPTHPITAGLVPLMGSSLAGASQPPRERPNPALAAWTFLKSKYPDVKSLEVSKTTNGMPSILLIPPASWKRYFSGAVVQQLTHPPGPGEVCSTDPDRPTMTYACCYGISGREHDPDSDFEFTIDCIQKYTWENKNQFGIQIVDAMYLNSFIYLFGAEIAKSTMLITKEQAAAGQLPGNKLLYGWGVLPSTGQWIVIDLSGDLLDRLAVTVSTLVGRIRSMPRPPLMNSDIRKCSINGLVAMPQSETVPAGTVNVYISRGVPVGVRTPPGIQKKYFSRALVRSNAQSTWIEMQPESAPPVGGTNRSLIEYLAGLRQLGGNPYACYGPNFTTDLINGANLLNNDEVSTIVFYLMYLDGIYNEFAPIVEKMINSLPPPTLKSAAPAQSSRPLLSSMFASFLGAGEQKERPTCIELCNANSSECLATYYIRDSRRESLRRLHDSFSKPQPINMTPKRLGELFNMNSDPMLALRGPTTVNNNELLNSGRDAVIKVSGDGIDAAITIPPKIVGRYAKNGGVISVSFRGPEQSPALQFSSLILHRTYGGVITRIDSDGRSLVATTQLSSREAYGCIQVPTENSPRSNSLVQAARMTGYALTTEVRSYALNTFVASSNHPEDVEGVCNTGSGYGGACPDCPVYVFNCIDPSGKSKKAEVRGVGAGKPQQALGTAESGCDVTSCRLVECRPSGQCG
jgi:hypothetical protein